MTAALAKQVHKPPGVIVPLRPDIVPRSDGALRADYDRCVEAYLFAVLNGAPRVFLTARAASPFVARDELRQRGGRAS